MLNSANNSVEVLAHTSTMLGIFYSMLMYINMNHHSDGETCNKVFSREGGKAFNTKDLCDGSGDEGCSAEKVNADDEELRRATYTSVVAKELDARDDFPLLSGHLTRISRPTNLQLCATELYWTCSCQPRDTCRIVIITTS